MLSLQSVGSFSDSHAWLYSVRLFAAVFPPAFSNSGCSPSIPGDLRFETGYCFMNFIGRCRVCVYIEFRSSWVVEVELYLRFWTI